MSQKSTEQSPKFINRATDSLNNDLKDGKNLEYYLNLTKDHVTDYPELVVKNVDGFNVIDDSEMGLIGSKARFGDFFVSQIKEKELVYCQPRTGFAGISLSHLAKKYDKNLTLFMPSSKKASDHQLICIELGCNPIFKRIAAMPNLNLYAKKYAEENGALFIPLGLRHELVTAGAVRCIHEFFKDKEHPKEFWTVMSTGVLSRALQIALPNTEFHAVAVARNIQQGELGRAKFYSYHKEFTKKADFLPIEFDSAENYDAKGFEYMVKHGSPGAWFWNVAGNVVPKSMKHTDVESYRAWPKNVEIVNEN